jgi:hypothetical protein
LSPPLIKPFKNGSSCWKGTIIRPILRRCCQLS